MEVPPAEERAMESVRGAHGCTLCDDSSLPDEVVLVRLAVEKKRDGALMNPNIGYVCGNCLSDYVETNQLSQGQRVSDDALKTVIANADPIPGGPDEITLTYVNF